MKTIKTITYCLTLLGAFSSISHAGDIVVSSDANIFGAGHTAPPAPGGGSGGSLPPSFSFTSSLAQVFTFSVSGSVALTPDFGFYGGDGNPSYSSDVSSFGGISGIRDNAGVGFLVGVFLDSTEPIGPSPSALDFSPSALGTSFLTLSPALGQTFFIGDGLTGTGTGTVQEFVAPVTATRLYLGFADASGYEGAPGQYQDNDGSFTVTVTETPEPSVFALLGIGLIALLAFRHEREYA